MNRITFAALCVLSASTAFANGGGKINPGPAGCNGCHFGGSTPTPTITPSATTVRAGDTIDLTVAVPAVNKNSTSGLGSAGFNLFASNGTFTAAGTGAKILSNQLTHTAPKLESGGTVTWSGNVWRAPAQGGTITFSLWGNSVNKDLTEGGDKANASLVTTTVTVTCDSQAVTCAGKSCGTVTDNCGQNVTCGSCTGTDVCSTSNVCVPAGFDAGVPDAGSGGGAGGGAGGGTGGGAGGGGGGSTTADAGTGGSDEAGGCSCNAAQGGMLALLAMGAMLLRANRRRA